MNNASLFALVTFTTFITAVAAGCEEHGCTLIGCDDQVRIVLTKVGSKFASGLPLEIVACVDDQCETVSFGESGGQFTCSAGSTNAAFCAGSPDGSIDILSCSGTPDRPAGHARST